MSSQPVPREAVLIVNAHSRRGEALFQEARDKLQAAGITLLDAHGVDDPARMPHLVRQAVRKGAPMVIVGGGDGTLSGTVDEVVNTGCVFAVLPLGTANSFARTLGIPLDLEEAIQCIATGQRRRIDLGMINDDYFVNAASIGLSPAIGKTIPPRLKKYLGRVGYLVWAARCFLDLKPFRVVIRDGAHERRLWSTEVRILNGQFHGGVQLTDNTDVDSGDIIIQVVTGRNRMSLILDWYAKFFSLRDVNTHTEDIRCTEIMLDTRPRRYISIDGEVLARTPARVRVAAAAIDVVAPCEQQEGQPDEG
ncbi:YegS/Rv2252/BmrU family lipid kinase [Pedomonas sp. V897]|uniref:YegS/Rv2252/BmrU family lipid kinase n=1 Tax=Pedomonas sp. V897 TaxID=3446482 RepID=UPI003EE41998